VDDVSGVGAEGRIRVTVLWLLLSWLAVSPLLAVGLGKSCEVLGRVTYPDMGVENAEDWLVAA
jgi:hypothetical protein